MKDPVFTGVCTALVTPFINERINYPMAELLLRRQIDAGVNAVVLAGTTGEAPTLTDEEKITLFHRCKNYVGDQCTIIAGTGSNSTSHTIALSIAAEQAGADALLVVSPYYNKSNHTGLVEHYTAIAQAVQIPIIIYNVPSRTGLDIPVSVYRKLSEIPNIVGIKEASGDITKQIKTHNSCGDCMRIWAGNDDQIIPSIALGGMGVISVLSNIYPKETSHMVQAALKGDYQTAARLQNCFSEKISLLFSDVNPIPVKFAMRCIGYDCGDCRLPLGRLSIAQQQKIAEVFQ